jgi:hypothetical protein
MKSKSRPLEDLETIRSIMEKSSRFLSLSGLSGVFSGLIAIAGAAIAFFVIFKGNFSREYLDSLGSGESKLIRFHTIADALTVLIAAISVAFIFSYRKSVKNGLKMWTPVTKRLLISMLVPLITGGLIIIVLYFQDQYQYIVPAMLIFYGLALVSAEKFTYNEIFYLGILEILTGLVSAIFPQSGIFLWGFGFGILHVIYGIVMYRKYER